MVAYNFQERFALAVALGEKRQTIRASGKRRHAMHGDTLQLYTGMRTKNCRLLATAVCDLSTYCAIREDGVTLGNHPRTDIDEFARADGFRDFEDMKAWFRKTHGLPFIGRLIRWGKPFAAATQSQSEEERSDDTVCSSSRGTPDTNPTDKLLRETERA